MAWFSDPANRDEAIKLKMEASKLKEADVEKSYDFLHKNLFENTGKVSKRKENNVLEALKALGDVKADSTVERLVLPGVTQISD